MSERRALLDPDMYKISEEDSQDEEVLSSLSSKVTVSLTVTNEGNNNLPVKVKPIPPVKPLFLRKVSNNINNNTIQTSSVSKGKLLEKPVEVKSSTTSIFQRRRSSSTKKGLPVHEQQSSHSGASESVEWPNSSSSSSNSSSSSESENSGEVSSGDGSRSRLMKKSGREGPHRGHLYKEMKRKRKKVLKHDGNQSTNRSGSERKAVRSNLSNQNYQVRGRETETDDEESGSSTESGHQSCSSCDNHRHSRRKTSSDQFGRYVQSDDNGSTGSYSTQYSSTDHPDSGESDLEFGDDDLYSDYLDDEESYALITENEIQSWTTEEGSVLFCEYFSARNSPEISKSANEETGAVLNRKSKPIHSSSFSNASQDTPEIESVSPEGNVDSLKSEKGQRIYKGKISRFLKRSSKKKEKRERGENVPGELAESSSKTKHTAQGGSGSVISQELKMKSKGNGSGAREKVFRFKDEHEGEIRQVELSITSYSKHNLGRRATMVESLLGIIPSRFSPTSTNSNIQQQQSSSTAAATVSDRQSSKFNIVPTAAGSSSNGRVTKAESEDKRIMVAGFIPDGPAARNRFIKIGDWLQQVNGVLVDFNNVNNVLLQAIQQDSGSAEDVPIKIRLELQRVSGYTVTESPTRNIFLENKSSDTASSRETRNRDKFLHSPKFSDAEIPSEIMSKIAVIYISVVSSPPLPTLPKEKTKDVIFAWPKESESRKVKALSASHGMFSTLYKLLKDVTGSNPISSRVMIDDEEMDVVFSSDDEGKGLLLLATAATLSNFNICQPQSSCSGGATRESQKKEKKLRWKDPVSGGLVLAHRIMSRVERLLRYQFGSLSRAFRSTAEVKLNHFLTQALAGLNDLSEDFMFLQVPSNILQIPPRIRCIVDERLYSFEASDSFSLCYGRRPIELNSPLFHCLGSCLYYKGMVVTSHLERNLASNFHGWWRTQLGLWGVKRNTLPCFWEPVRRLVVWQETFQHLERNEVQDDVLEVPLPCYSVLLGLGNFMLGMVLESAVPDQRVESVDIGWIRRGFSCVLRTLNSEIHASLEKCVRTQEDSEFIELYPPPGASNKNVLSGNATSPGNKKIPKTSTVGPTSSILKNTETQSTPVTSTINSAGPSGLFTSSGVKTLIGQNLGSRNHLFSEISEANNLESEITPSYPNQDYSYHYGLSVSSNLTERLTAPNSDDDEEIEENTMGTGSDTSSFKWNADEFDRLQDISLEEGMKTVSVTKGNVLFDFIQIEHGRSIMLSSKDNLEGPYSVVIHNFRQSATVSHHILHKASNGRKRLSQQGSDKKWVSKALTPISEHGILFNCDVVDPRDAHKRKPRLRQVSYWVIGRIYPNQREIYLCYQDSSVAQNLLEIAFKIAYHSS